VAKPKWVVFNRALAISLGLDPETLQDACIFTGNKLPKGAMPIAQAYAGHQFGHSTQLGDGRAILLGEHLDASGQRFDVQLKGAGRTPFFRGGDETASCLDRPITKLFVELKPSRFPLSTGMRKVRRIREIKKAVRLIITPRKTH
jgi:Protein adenylyltransferase SelO